jgi:hypothetical protein
MRRRDGGGGRLPHQGLKHPSKVTELGRHRDSGYDGGAHRRRNIFVDHRLRVQRHRRIHQPANTTQDNAQADQ